jgi:hypothetical protein
VVVELADVALLDVDMMAGIEYEEFPARIAEVAMWLMDHQMNLKMSMEFGQYFARLPLTKSARIVNANALRINWEEVVSKNELSFILGNPPFLGKSNQTQSQKSDLLFVFNNVKSSSDLDYVSAWFYKASEYIHNSKIQVAFVSTNSITQGEQVSILWGTLKNRYNININFAHQTFKWINEAKGIAAVHCVVIGFACFERNKKVLFEYDKVTAEPKETLVKNINPYLTSGPSVIIEKRSNSICEAPPIKYGNKPTDDGNFLFNEEEKQKFLKEEPGAERYIKRFIGSVEFINNIPRYCLWLHNADPKELRNLPKVLERVNNVREFRLKSSAKPTIKAADYPTDFFYTSHPNTEYLVIPETSSERRKYVPIGYISPETIASNAVYLIPSASHYTFGMMCSIMHVLWLRTIGGRLKSDFRYSGSIVYNNFPWPENPTDKQKEAIDKAAQNVLDARAEFPNSSLADLYDPLTMPPVLVKAHNELDKAVDLAYRSQPFTSDANRMEFLFELYEKYTAGLFVVEKKSKSTKGKK